jgi:integrase
MATLQLRNNSYRVLFCYRGKRHTFTIGEVSEKEAEIVSSDVDRVLLRIEQRLLKVPTGVDIVAFVQSGGQAPEPEPAGEDAGVTLPKLRDAYLGTHANGALESNSLTTIKIHLSHMTATLGESFRVQKLTQPDLQKHIDRRTKAKGIHGAKLSPATLRKEIASFRAVWNWGMTANLVAIPFPNKGLVYPKADEKPPFMTWAEIDQRIAAGGLRKAEVRQLWDSLFLTLAEVGELLAHVRSTARNPWLYPMICFAAHTGARRSEILRTRRHDVALAGGTVLLREKKRSKSKRTTRRVPLSPFLTEVLKTWLADHPGGQQLFCQVGEVPRSKKHRPEPLPITRDEAHDHFQRVLAGSKWDKLRGWHVLRHSFASKCAAKGVDQRLIDEWMGHQTEEMRKRYRHLIPSTQQEAIRAVFG